MEKSLNSNQKMVLDTQLSTKEATPAASATNPPNPEVQDKRPRRRFTAEYQLKILAELERCKSGAERGSIMRKEGLYSSRITEWRKARNTGALSALNRIPGRKPKNDAKDEQIKSLQDKVGLLEKQVVQGQAIIEVQKKVSEIFGCIIPSNHGLC